MNPLSAYDWTWLPAAAIASVTTIAALETALLLAIWHYCGAHITKTLAESAKRSVDGRLGKTRKTS